MEITADDLKKYIYDPASMQQLIFNTLETSAGLSINNPTSPFVMLMEATCVNASNAANESKALMRKKYPNLAITPEELYHHISDDELANMFAVPAVADISFYVNIRELRQFGFRPAGANYSETTIPNKTKITINETVPLTILNDIVIRLYDNNQIFVEQQVNNSNDLAINDIGIIKAYLYNTEADESWIVFTTKVKQILINTVSTTASTDSDTIKVVPITNKYCYSEVSFKGSSNGTYTRIPVSHNDEYIDPTIATAFVAPYDKNVMVTIPTVYLINNKVSGNLNIDIYETVGKVYLPINKYEIQAFTIELGDTGKSVSASTSPGVTMFVVGSSILDGGTDGMTLTELRNSIIFNSTGDIDLPVTDIQIARVGSMDGFYVYKTKDLITDRLYVASKNVPALTNTRLIYAKQDVFFNTAKIVVSEIANNRYVAVDEDNFIIKSGALFKYNNGVMELVSNDQLDYISTLNSVEKITYLKNNKFYYTPFYYILNLKDGYTTCRIYSLDYPAINGYRIVNKNTSILPTANIKKYDIDKTTTGYRLVLTLSTNSEFDKIEKGNIKIQLEVRLKGDEVSVYFDSEYDYTLEAYIIDITSDMFIDADGYINILNGMSTLNTKAINIESDVKLRIYTTDVTVTDETKFLVDNIFRPSGLKSHVVFSEEFMKLEFGKKIDYMWNRVYNTYSSRKYKTYDADIPYRYTEDVYEVFENGSTIKMVFVDGVLTPYRNKIHSKGDLVKDGNGNTVLLHAKGDNVLDGNNNPIVDLLGGLIRYIDFLMLEYEFIVADNLYYRNYINTTMDVIYNYLFTYLPSMNNKLLDNTSLVYKSSKSCKPVTLLANSLSYTVDYIVTPTVVLYFNAGIIPTAEEISSYKITIGKIIDSYLDQDTIKLQDIKSEIVNTIGGGLIAAKVTGLEKTDAEIISIDKTANRLVLAKLLEFNTNNELVVKYDINLSIANI